MRRFRDGEIDILISTTVIEVGIDVANATVMLIEHPERFGLSQLHQLRGRVGRGAEESFCILLGDVSPEVADPIRDRELSEVARDGAARLLGSDPGLASKANKPLHDVLRKRYGRALELFRVG